MNTMKMCSGWQKPVKVRAVASVVAAVLSLASGGEPAKAPEPEKHATFREILAARPGPDLSRLAELSAPEVGGAPATESFYDILKLRENANAAALPVLERILKDNLSTTRIHGFAAAQALSCIGTPEAGEILSQHLLTGQ